MIPLLIMLFGVHPATAVGTDLLCAAVTKSAGTLIHGCTNRLDWCVVCRLAAGNVPMTVLTLLIFSRFDINGSAAQGLINAAEHRARRNRCGIDLSQQQDLGILRRAGWRIGPSADDRFDNGDWGRARRAGIGWRRRPS